MMSSRSLGSIELFQIIELLGPTHDAEWMFPGIPRDVLDANASWLSPDYWMPLTNRLVFSFQLWVLKTRDRIILVDTGIGNHKDRPAPTQHMINTPTLDWLAAIGAPPEAVTHVVQTHLHGDHVGWNTRFVDGRWVPTFPNATYLMPRLDWHAFKARYDAGERGRFGGPIGDSVLPIVEAGLAQFVDPEDEVAGCLLALAAPGHTPGQLAYALRQAGEEYIFSGDVIHSPIQIPFPEITCRWCEEPEQARRTRIALLERAAANRATILPAHAKSMRGWRVTRQGGGFAVHL
jgi:glyoxylase-like metal-dependent hydrolase (beta-lactamase superfamily II)